MIQGLRLALLGLWLLGAPTIALAADLAFPRQTWAEPASAEASAWSRDRLRAADRIAASLGTEAYLVVHRGALVLLERASRYPAYVMKLSARDLARFGLLMARDGRWHDRQIVSPAWVAASTVAYSTAPGGWHGYGYLWWVPQRAWPFWTRSPGTVFFAWGNGGQYVLVDRKRDLVIVHQVDRSRLCARNVRPEALGDLLGQILQASPEP